MGEPEESNSASDMGPVREFQDPLYEALTNKRRQFVLRYLIENEGEAEFSDLVEFVASRENDVLPSQLSHEHKNRVRASLYQHHLDKMESCGLISYDKGEGTIRLTSDKAEISEHLGYSSTSLETVLAYGFGLITLGLAVPIYLFSSAGIFIPMLVGSVGVAQIILCYKLEGETLSEVSLSQYWALWFQ